MFTEILVSAMIGVPAVMGVLPEPEEVTVKNLKAENISVSTIKVNFDAESDIDYKVECIPTDPETGFTENIYIDKEHNGKYYINGLREGSEYKISVKPIIDRKEFKYSKAETIKASTEKVKHIWDFPYEDGWTNCFTYETSAGLTANPSWNAIQGAVKDTVTDTGIMRDEYGDYCCAMGLFYGVCGDRFIVELNNGVQFTVKLCDSKGAGDDGTGRYHDFGGGGKSVIEFIHEKDSLPACVSFTGNYGSYKWKGLNFDNIASIHQIDYGKKVKY